MPRFFNQDCVDIVVEYAVGRAADAYLLRGVSVAFGIGVTNRTKGMLREQLALEPGTLNTRMISALRDGRRQSFEWHLSELAAARVCVILLHADITHVDLPGGWPLRSPSQFRYRNAETNTRTRLALAETTDLAVAEHCPKLEFLDASSSLLSDAAVEAYAKKCPLLHTLNVSETELTDAGLSVASAFATQLRSLNIVGCEKLTNFGVRTISRQAPHLREVAMDPHRDLSYLAERCIGLKRLSLQHSVDYFGTGAKHTLVSLAAVAKHCGALEDLTVGCRARRPCKEELPASPKLREVVRGLPQLRRLTLHCVAVTNADLEYFAASLPALEGLALPRGSKFDDKGITAFVRSRRGLRSLDLDGATGVSYVTLLALAAFCPRLEELNVSKNSRIDDAGLTALAERCTGLRTLDVHSTNVGDEGFAAVVAHSAALESLDVSGCGRVSHSAVLAATLPDSSPGIHREAAQRIPLWRIRSLVVSPTAYVREVSFMRIAKR